jgi:low temperature requirement protein LtrA
MSTLALWQKPELRRDEDEDRERKATWLELFYDLVFVVIIAQLSHGLAGDVSWRGLANFALPFVPAWWLWIGGTIYADRFETEDIGHRVLTFLQMVPVAAMAVFLHHGLEQDSAGFALAYACGRVLIIVMWVRGGWHNPEARPVTNLFAVGFSTSVVIFLGSLLVPAPQRFQLWTVALVIDLLVPLTTIPYQKDLPKFSTSRLPERFGLFTIIVLGETVVGVVSGLAEVHHLTWQTGLVGLLGMGLAFGLWWLYFDGVSHQAPRGGLRSSLARNYLHLPLVLGITAVGAAVLGVVEHADHGVEAPVRWLLCGAVATVFVCLALLTLVVKRATRRYGRRVPVIGLLTASVVVLVLAAVDVIHGAIALVGTVLVVVIALVALDVWMRRVRA